jgi:hypothetical protein
MIDNVLMWIDSNRDGFTTFLLFLDNRCIDWLPDSRHWSLEAPYLVPHQPFLDLSRSLAAMTESRIFT